MSDQQELRHLLSELWGWGLMRTEQRGHLVEQVEAKFAAPVQVERPDEDEEPLRFPPPKITGRGTAKIEPTVAAARLPVQPDEERGSDANDLGPGRVSADKATGEMLWADESIKAVVLTDEEITDAMVARATAVMAAPSMHAKLRDQVREALEAALAARSAPSKEKP